MYILTFDFEEWFHLLDYPATREVMQWNRFPARIEANLDRVLQILEDTSCRATFFCLGWMAEKYPKLVRRIADKGYHLATHSHLHQLAYEQTPDQFRTDLRTSMAAIADATGQMVDTYRVPGFSITEKNLWAFEILAEEGIKIDSSVFPASRGHGGLPMFATDRPCIIETSSGRLFEFPINIKTIGFTRLVFSGGGYFRLLPYQLIKKWFAQSDYVMTYFHPRDFDPNQPVIDGLPLARRFKSYVGLQSSEKKLRTLLHDFDFIDVAQASRQTCWEEKHTVPIKTCVRL